MIEERIAAAGLPPLTRLSWLEIDVDALANNLRLTRQVAGTGVDVAAVVKADGYGHGAEAAARAFVEAGATRLCVATLDEALVLRAAGIKAPLLVLFRVPDEQLAVAAENLIELVVSDESTVGAIVRSACKLTVHVEVETGLERAGVRPDRVLGVVRGLSQVKDVFIGGLWTHLATSDDAVATAEQVELFERAVSVIRNAGLPVPPRHIAASGALFARTAPSYEAVRPGLCLYGLIPEDLPVAAENQAAAGELRPAMALRARPLRVERLGTGAGVGYGSRWRAERPSLVATLPVGYSDGWPRSSWPGAEALVHGRRVPFVGTVAMDATMVDVTDIPGVDLRSEFTLLGTDDDQSISAFDLARLRNTISWEVVATMAQRLPRVYHRGPVLVGTRTLIGYHTTE
jgi:alanine racemase